MDQKKKVLIAEDDTFLATAYRAKLIKAGFAIQIAQDGDQALQMLKQFQPDIVLLDLVMPKKDGFQTLSEIKANPEFRGIPVIIASNLGQSEDIVRAMRLGAADYIVKSGIRLEDVVNKINHYLNLPPHA